jgi:hypothetical protein
MICQPPTDRFGDPVDIAVHAPEALAHFLALYQQPGIAGAGRVYEHEIGEIEPGIRIVYWRDVRRAKARPARSGRVLPPPTSPSMLKQKNSNAVLRGEAAYARLLYFRVARPSRRHAAHRR